MDSQRRRVDASEFAMEESSDSKSFIASCTKGDLWDRRCAYREALAIARAHNQATGHNSGVLPSDKAC